MTLTSRTMPRALALALAGAVAACSHTPRLQKEISKPTQATAATEIDGILALLDQGDVKAAQRRIGAALKRDPMNASVLVLRDSIAHDPKELLGPASYPYTSRAGDTMSGLAERFLGTRLKSYQLSRYNGIAKPASLAAGQVLRIPGEPPHAEAPRRVEPRTTASPAVTTAAKPRPVIVKPSVAKPTANPVAARQARAAGLAALNEGNVARAVALLARAAALDPANPVIARDLARADRIAATVRAHK